jgi:endonuclease I
VASRICIFVTALALCATAGAAAFDQVSPPRTTYYDSPLWMARTNLRAQWVATVARGHQVVPYSSSSFDTSDALKIIDQDPANTNNVILLYARRSEAKTNFAVTGGWNREHVWPNSYGIDDRHPAYSDLHNLRPEDEDVNSARGNKYFDISQTGHVSYRFPAHPEAPQCSTDFDSWSPPDSVRGDVARVILYMDLRYEGIGGEPNLVVLDTVQRITSETNFMGRLRTLLLWHEWDPVDDAERGRNDRVESIQGNRNPFVDRPTLVRGLYWPILHQTAITNLSGVITDFHIQWPADYTASLESSSDLSNWSLVTGPFLVNGEFIDTFLRPQSRVQAFRLRLW